MTVLVGIPTISKRPNYAAVACASYAQETENVIVVDQGGGEVVEGYKEGTSWIRTKHDNLLAQIRTICTTAILDGFDYVVLLDDDVTYLAPLAEDNGSYRIQSKADVEGADNWHQAITHKSLKFIEENVEAFFEDESRSMVQIATRLFFPKPGVEVPYVTPRDLKRFPTVFNDHVIWRTECLNEVLSVFENLGVLNYSAGVDKSAALVNNILGYTVGKLEWVRATKRDITGNSDSTIYDFSGMSEEERNLHRNVEDAKALVKIRPFVEESGLYFWASLSRAGMLNHFNRTDKKFTLDEMIEDFTERAIEKNRSRSENRDPESEEAEEAEEAEEDDVEDPDEEDENIVSVDTDNPVFRVLMETAVQTDSTAPIVAALRLIDEGLI